MTPWIYLIGIGEDGLDGLSARAKQALSQARAVWGGQRHLNMLRNNSRPLHAWPSPFSVPATEMRSYGPEPIAVLASGDPFHYGVGKALLRHFKPQELLTIPASSAFSLAAARMGWSLEDVSCITLHGRPLANLSYALEPGAKIIALGVGDTAQKAADLMTKLGYGPSQLTALSHLGGPRETFQSHRVLNWPLVALDDLTTLAIDCRLDHNRATFARTPGLPDDAFQHDGQLTKRDIRALTLSKLAPRSGELLWDVGAGCGSIAIEWLRATPKGRAAAIEANAQRMGMILANAEALGAPGLQLVSGQAPEALNGLDQPDAIFIGGGVSAPGMLATCWRALKPGGRLVANAVTLEAEAAILELAANRPKDCRQVEISRIHIEQVKPLGSMNTWRPLLPITQLEAHKN